ncbi:hypothetical protein PGT21_025350 [Puccinia graminis f. sp. tritici]|uniref:Uncharacterized protein n=1 Tax=Puccinia graminis f. sp. tritici TaxID=56615 RepID=A0A5B0REW8_PUCGR|nr:hypothetical protein PGT21_025350 [Puccinia graminis f. sp. tritici]KAA1123455.1 hypothetical protein PGTUg99_013125 [Puccinia graminis f. sp. tritici]
MTVGSIAFSAPEGSYFFVMDLNVQRGGSAGGNGGGTGGSSSGEAHHSKSFNSSVSNISASSSNSNITPMANNSLNQPNLNGNQTGTSSNTSNAPAAIAITTNSAPQIPIVQVPAVPGIPANADVSQNLVAPPLYPCSLATVIINFPPVPPPNPFPHPGFLTAATKYARSKDTATDPLANESHPNEQTDSNASSTDDPSTSSSNTYPSSSSNNQAGGSSEKTSLPPNSRSVASPIKNRALNFSSTLSSLSNASRNGTHSLSSYATNSQSNLNPLSSRPRAAFKGSTSTFIKSSEGLPLPQSVIKTFYGSSSESSSSTGRDEGEERTFAFYTWNKSVIFAQLSPSRPAGETLFRLSFADNPTHVSLNHHTVSATSLDVVIGFSTGDLIYFDPFCARYTRLNKGGCISGSAVSKIEWLAPTVTRRDGHFVSSHVDGTLICWDKEREDWNGFVVDPWPKTQQTHSTPHPSAPHLPSSPLNRKKLNNHPPRPHADPRDHDILISGLNHNLPIEKRNRLNPVSHWKVSRKAITDFAYSPDSKFCAIVSEDGCLRIIDTYSEKLLDTYLSYFGALLCVCWSSDGRFVFTGGQDDLVTAYSPIEQRVIARCQGHGSFVTGLSFDPWFSDDRSCRFASVSEDCKLIFWDLSGASLAKPRLQQINSQSNHATSRRQSLVSNGSSPVHPHQSQHNNHTSSSVGSSGKNHKRGKVGLVDSSITLPAPAISDQPRHRLHLDQQSNTFGVPLYNRDFHSAPGRNEVAILQPVMVKEIGIDPLSSINYHRDLVVVASRTGQINVFGRPTPPPAPPSVHNNSDSTH